MFFSYCHADEALRDQIEKQLSLLKRQGVVETWHDRRIEAGQDFAAEIDCHIETDDIILCWSARTSSRRTIVTRLS